MLHGVKCNSLFAFPASRSRFERGLVLEIFSGSLASRLWVRSSFLSYFFAISVSWKISRCLAGVLLLFAFCCVLVRLLHFNWLVAVFPIRSLLSLRSRSAVSSALAFSSIWNNIAEQHGWK